MELRRRWRALQDNATQLVAIGIALLFFLPMSLVIPTIAFWFGGAVADGAIDAPVELARTAAVALFAFVAVFGGIRAYSTVMDPDNLDGLLTTVSHRELLAGLLLAETTLWSVPVGVGGLVAAAAFAAGSGSILGGLSLFVAIVGTATAALLVGVVVALVVRNAGARSVLLTRLRNAVSVIAVLAYFWLLVSGSFDSILDPAFRLLTPTPIGWAGDLALLGIGGDPLYAVGALATLGVAMGAGGPVLSALAAWLWYADGVHVTHEEASSAAGRSRLDALLPRSEVGVVRADWKRARRKPITLSYALYPLIVLVGPVTTSVQSGAVTGSLALWTLLCGAWITGALFTLNVLGHEGAALPVSLLGHDPGRTLVRGHVLAGVLIGAPITVAVTIAVAAAGPYPLALVATLGASAVVTAVVAATMATGVGVAFPRFEAVSVSRSTKAVVPSVFAFAGFTLLISVVALPALLAHTSVVGAWIASQIGTPWVVVAAVGTATTAIVGGVAGVASLRVAARRVEAYRVS